MIESYNEKIEYYENLKKQWQDITDAYENEQADLLTAQMFGADWESQILSGRLDILANFKNQYITTQQDIANAAWESAHAQVEAYNYAQSNTGGGAATPIVGDFVTNPTYGEIETYTFGDRVFNSESERDAYAAEYRKMVDEANEREKERQKKEIEELKRNAISSTQGSTKLLMKYHEGLEKGYVGGKYRSLTDDERLALFQKFAKKDMNPNEVPAILQRGELVMTHDQQVNIAKGLLYNPINRVQEIASKIVGNSNGIYNQNPQPVVTTIGDIHLHGVQNVRDFGNELQKYLPNISVQRNGRH